MLSPHGRAVLAAQRSALGRSIRLFGQRYGNETDSASEFSSPALVLGFGLSLADFVVFFCHHAATVHLRFSKLLNNSG